MSDETTKKPKATLIKHELPVSPPGTDDAKEKKKVVVIKKKVVVVKKPVPKSKVKKEEGQKEPLEGKEPAASAVKKGKREETGSQTGLEMKNQTAETSVREKAKPDKKGKEELSTQTISAQDTSAGKKSAAGKDTALSLESGTAKETAAPKTAAREPAFTRGTTISREGYPKRDLVKPQPKMAYPRGYQPPPGQVQQQTTQTPRYQAGSRPPVRKDEAGPRPFNRDRRPDTRTGRPPFTRPPGSKYPPGTKPPASDIAADKKPGNKKFFKAKKKPSYQKLKRDEFQEKYVQVKKKPTQKANPVPKEIDIMEVVTVAELAKKMNLKASDLISKLMNLGMMVTINQQIDADTASILAGEYGCKVKIVSLFEETIIENFQDSAEDLEHRPPVVTVMGHVDHGKTKLLDAIRTSNVVDSEYGGITQHIGAYLVDHQKGRVIFLDTPGHEAFTHMRARGAQVTDIVVLVVAANDGVMPQTVEAINHAKAAKVPIIVAINKIDLPEANLDRVKQQLSDYDLIPEAWGGSTLFCEVSALKRTGIDELLDMILLQAEILELKANFACRAEGKVLESKIDHGRGIVSTVLIQRGTLRVGDAFVAGIFPGRVRAIFDDKGEKMEDATPSTPVEILGFTGLANAGDPFQVTESEKVARVVGNKRQELKKVEEAQNVKKITLENLYDSIQEGEVQELKVIIKGDVHGSVEALQLALEKLSTKEIRLSVIHASAGAINDSDINLASASSAIIIAFHVRPTGKAQALADQEKVQIKKYNIIYDAVNDIKSAMEGLLAPDIEEESAGIAEVRELFKVPKIGFIAGCFVISGKINRGSQAHVIRDGIEIYTGKISSLRRFKDDVREVETNYECGIGIENFTDLKPGDQIEAFKLKEIAKKLGSD
ncbi:MAG: translation initiation factor IF-2 [Spirochaetales bacterium]|nr:MAG: translation initiation factor IF-2 [Spirochaetales bacterium]